MWFARGLLVVGHGLFLVCLCFAVCGSFLCCVPCVPWCPLVFPRVPCVSFFCALPVPMPRQVEQCPKIQDDPGGFINHSFSELFRCFFRGDSMITVFEMFNVCLAPLGHLFGRFLPHIFDVFSICENTVVPRRFVEVFWSLLPTKVFVLYKDY